jgi:hydroxylysine kinase
MTGPVAAFDPPEVEPERVRSILGEHWGLRGETTRLAGERSHNTRVVDRVGRAWTLQVQGAGEDPTVIDLRSRAMLHLERHAPDVPVPRVVPTIDGSIHAELEIGGRSHLARLVTYLPGTTFDPTEVLPARAYERIGSLLAAIAEALAGFEHPAADHPMPWDLGHGLFVDESLRRESDPAARRVVADVDDRLHAVVGTLATLPHRIVHNDGHAGNLVRPATTSHEVVGIIDFGDLVWTATAADVAIIAESFAPDHPDPAAVVAAIVTGYARRVRLDDDEIAAIPELVLARMALTVLLGDFQIRHAPHLAANAAAVRRQVADRLRRWARLDRSAMIGRTHDALELERARP